MADRHSKQTWRNERVNERKAPAQPLMCVRAPYGGWFGTIVRKTLELRKARERGHATPVCESSNPEIPGEYNRIAG